MYKRLGAFVLAAVVLPAGSVAAQEKGQVGLAMGYPASVAVIFHATDAFAVRPEFNFSTSSTTTNYTSSSTTSDTTAFGVGVSALLYAAKWDNLHAYFSPRFTYARSTTDYTGTSSTSNATSSTYTVSGSFGAQYSLGRRFAVFGEVGLAYSHLTGESSSNAVLVTNSSSSGTGNAWSTRTAIGGIFYFK